MSIVVKAGLAAALALGPALSMAAYAASQPVAGPALGSALPVAPYLIENTADSVSRQGPLAAGFLGRSVAQAGPSEAVGQSADAADAMKVALAAKPRSTPVFGNLRGDAGLLLWNFCVLVRAQQDRQAFELVDVGITAVHLSEDIARVSAVPLPGAIWLFVMAVLGLAGTRVTGLGTGRDVSRGTDAVVTASPNRGPVLV